MPGERERAGGGRRLGREAVLLRSAERLVGDGRSVLAAAHGWRRHPRMLPYAMGAFVAPAAMAAATGFATWSGCLSIGAVGAAVAVTATTDHLAVVSTAGGTFWCRASRFRCTATRIEERLGVGEIRPVGGNQLVVDWDVVGRPLSVPRRSDRAMAVIAERHPRT